MPQYMGSYYHQIDAKNRIRIPAKLRGAKAETEGEEKKYTLYFRKGVDKCVSVYTEEEVDAIIEKLSTIPQHDTVRYRAARQYAGTFIPIESDPQGRFVLPAQLKDYAGLEKEIVVCGNMDHIDIWSQANYELNIDDGNLDVNKIISVLDIL